MKVIVCYGYLMIKLGVEMGRGWEGVGGGEKKENIVIRKILIFKEIFIFWIFNDSF